MELELKRNILSGILILGVVLTSLAVIFALQFMGLGIGLNLGFQNAPLF